MSEDKPTPTPWLIGVGNHFKYNEDHLFISHTREAGRTVCSISPMSDLDDEDRANAAHIVHCVNTYEEREALLKEMGESLGKIDKLQDLWLPTKHFLPEHEGEIQALKRMSEQIKSTLEKYKSHTS